MPKRLFIAINLPKNVKDRIHDEVEHHLRPVFGQEIRFVHPDNWHITLAFLGGQKDDLLEIIQHAMARVAEKSSSIHLEFDRVCYGPPRLGEADPPKRDASMIWLMGTKSAAKQLNKISEQLITELKDRKISFKIEHRPLATHITLLRFGRSEKFPRVLPLIEKKVSISFTAGQIDLMESTLNTPAGSDYKVIFSTSFKK